jgi:hypothetical protein
VVATHNSFYTPFHADFEGTTGWMFLARGRKEWSFWNPLKADTRAFLDDRNGSMPAPHFTISAGPGDLVIVPSGWPHSVTTTGDAFGIGGSFTRKHFFAGLHTALLDEAASVGYRGAALKRQVARRRRRAIVKRSGISCKDIGRIEDAEQGEMRRQCEESGVGVSTKCQAKHASRTGPGKRKRRQGVVKAGRRVDKKVERHRVCKHLEHDTTSSGRLGRRALKGVWYDKIVLMCQACAKIFKYHAAYHRKLVE